MWHPLITYARSSICNRRGLLASLCDPFFTSPSGLSIARNSAPIRRWINLHMVRFIQPLPGIVISHTYITIFVMLNQNKFSRLWKICSGGSPPMHVFPYVCEKKCSASQLRQRLFTRAVHIEGFRRSKYASVSIEIASLPHSRSPMVVVISGFIWQLDHRFHILPKRRACTLLTLLGIAAVTFRRI